MGGSELKAAIVHRSRIGLPWVVPVCVLLFGTCALFSEVIFQRRVLFFGDLSLYFLPQQAFFREEFLNGRIPLWNPYVNSGQPFVGNPQTWPLYPGSLLLLFFEAPQAIAFSAVFHVGWAGLGMLTFLRSRGCSTLATTLGAGVFAFGGGLVSKGQFPNMLQAMAWLPWLLFAGERLLERPSGRRAGVFGLCLGLSLLAAHAQVTLMQFYLGLAWSIFRLRELPIVARRRAIEHLMMGVGLGLLLAMAQLLPTLEHVLVSGRRTMSLAVANRFILPWSELVLLVLPNYYGNPALEDGWWGVENFWEPCCYVGILTLGLIVAALFGRVSAEGKREKRFWFASSVVCIWLALGAEAGLYRVAFVIVPGVRYFHDPVRWLYISAFSLAVLAARSLDEFSIAEVWKRGFVVLALAELIAFSRTLNPTCDPDELVRGRARLRASLVGVQRVFRTDPSADWGRFAPHRKYSQIRIEDHIASGIPNLPFWVGTRQWGGYEPVTRRDTEKQQEGFERSIVKPSDRQLQRLRAAAVTRVEGQRMSRVVEGSEPLVSGGDVVRAIPGQFEITIANDSSSVVVVRETAASGWSASVDGERRQLVHNGGIFIQIPVRSGEKHLVLTYSPASWRYGCVISLLAGSCLLGLMAHGRKNQSMPRKA